MRRNVCAMLSVLAMVMCCRPLAAQESSSRWNWLWPFGEEEGAAQPYPATKTPTAEKAPPQNRGHLITMPEMPEMHWPEYSMPKPQMPSLWPNKETEKAETPRSAWMDTHPEPEEASPWQVAKESTQRLGESTRHAWDKTVNVLTPEYLKSNDRPSERVAQRPPVWKRALGLEEEKPQGPQTVTEWMAQERLNP
jgi:hypothetical protein